MEPIPLALVRAGRDLTEPKLSPDGRWVAFVQRQGTTTSINRVEATGDGIERQLTFGPPPAPGRGSEVGASPGCDEVVMPRSCTRRPTVNCGIRTR